MTRWAIYLTATGELVQTFVYPTHPRFGGFDWQSGVHTATAIADACDPAVQSWSKTAKAMADDPAKVGAQLIALVKAEAERRKMMVATPGGFKKTEYAEKRAEVIAWESLAGTAAAILTAFNLLPVAVRTLRFGWAIAEQAKFGESSPAPAIARFRAAIMRSGGPEPIGATEQKAVADINAATTVAAQRAAFAAINWSA